MRRPFISYSHDDKDVVERRVLSHLEAAGIDVFRDVDDLGPGRFQDQLRAAISECSVLLVVVSRGARESEWVDSEIGYAKKHGRRVLPILLDDTHPADIDLRLEAHQAYSCRSDAEAEATAPSLVRAIQDPESAPAPPRFRRWPWRKLVAALAIALLSVGVFALLDDDAEQGVRYTRAELEAMKGQLGSMKTSAARVLLSRSQKLTMLSLQGSAPSPGRWSEIQSVLPAKIEHVERLERDLAQLAVKLKPAHEDLVVRLREVYRQTQTVYADMKGKPFAEAPRRYQAWGEALKDLRSRLLRIIQELGAAIDAVEAALQ